MRQPGQPTKRTWLILAVALILRLGVLVVIGISSAGLDDPLTSRAFNGGDSEQYILLAQNIVEHGAFSLEKSESFAPNIRRTPGYPLLLAFLYILAGQQHDPVLIVALQVVLAVTNVWLAIHIGTRLFSPLLGQLAGWFYAFAPATLIFTGLVMTETLFATLLLSGTLLCVHMCQPDRGKVAWFLAALTGIVFAALAYTRPIALYFVPIPALAVLIRMRWMRQAFALSGIMLFAFLAAVAPWFYRNYVHFDSVIFTSIGNQNLLFYNVSSIEAKRQNISWDRAKEQLWDEYAQRLRQEYPNPTLADESHLAGKLAREHMLRHPLDALLYQTLDSLNVLRPGYSMANLILHDDGEDVGREVQDGNLRVLLSGNVLDRIVYIAMTIYYLVLYVAVALGSAALVWRRDWFSLVLIGLTSVYFLYLPGIAGNARFRAPLEGHLALVGAVGLITITRLEWKTQVKRFTEQRNAAAGR